MTLRNAFEEMATETSLEALLTHMMEGRTRVGTSRARFRDDFLTFDTTSTWNLLQTGPGQVISLAGVLNGSRYLNVNTGTQIGETIFQTKESFKPAIKMAFAVTLSQRIAGQEFYVELVEVDADGNVVEDTSVFTAPTVNNAMNVIGVLYDGTSTTSNKYVARAEGLPEVTPSAVSFGTSNATATGTAPNFNPGTHVEFLLQTELFTISTRGVNSTGTATATPASRTDYVPNPNSNYAVRVRIKNTAVPASATDFRLHYVRVVDASRLSVDFGIIGGTDMQMLAAPVRVLSAPTTTMQAIHTTTTESATNLAANGVYTGASRDLGSTIYARRVLVYAHANQAGVMRVEFSTDGTTFRRGSEDIALAANGVINYEFNPATRYFRVIYTNGATAQTVFLLTHMQFRT